MKVFGQILAALLVTAVAAAASIEMRPEVPENEARRPCYGRRYHSGCFSIVGSLVPVNPYPTSLWRTDLEFQASHDAPLWNLLQTVAEGTIATAKPSEGNTRTKRAEKAVATVLGRRRAKQRGEGTKPACPGCYSWLTMLGPPVQGGKTAGAKFSHSESGESSSGGN